MSTDIDRAPITPQQYEILHGGGAEAAEIAKQRLSRRRFLRRSMLAIWGLSTTASVAGALYMLYPNLSASTGSFGSIIDIGKKSQFQAGTPEQLSNNTLGVYHLPVPRTWLIHLSKDTKFLLTGADLTSQMQSEWWVKDSDGSYWIALYQRCVHLGCTVPFRDDCHAFKCPCHGSHYNVDGEYLDGPAPRSLDRFQMSFSSAGDVMVNTGVLNYPSHPVPHPDASTRILPVPTVQCSAG